MQTMSFACRAWLVLAILLPGTIGCGIDEHYTSLGNKALPGEPLNPIQDDVVCVTQSCDCGDVTVADADYGTLSVDDLTGYAWRFDTLVFTQPLTGSLAKGLNDALAKQIEEGTLNILMVGTLDDRPNGHIDFSLGSGVAVDGGYRFDGEPDTLGCALNGATFTTVLSSSLVVPNNMTDPAVLPINQLSLSGRLSSDALGIGSGVLEGLLTQADAQATKLAGADLATLLVGLGVNPDRDMDSDGTNDAWLFVGTFSAVSTTIK